MNVVDGPLPGLKIVEPRVFQDDRGYFFESYQRRRYMESGLDLVFVQDNEAASEIGVIRGLHYQVGEAAQAKLVRVIRGAVLDVVVDIRMESPAYGKSFSIELSAQNKKQLLIPRGFAHGYAVLQEGSIFSYKCDNYYNKEAEAGIRFDDPDLVIQWPFDKNHIRVSEKDLKLPFFGQHRPF